MSLKELISTVGILALLRGCASSGVVIPAKRPIKKYDSYVLECYDKNKNGLCDSYIIEGKNVFPIPITFDTFDEEANPINLRSRLEKQGLNVIKVHRNY